jgi:accessory colonization factor AcfC
MNMSMDINDAIIKWNHWPMRENDLHFLVKLYIDGFIYDCYTARLISHAAQTVMISPDQGNFSMQLFS